MTAGRDAEFGAKFGDRVRVRVTSATEAAGLAGRLGTIHGWTTPSLGYATNVIGDPIDDVALALHFGDDKPAVWLTPDLVEFVDHQAGLTMGIAGHEFIRRADGSWEGIPPTAGPGPGRP